MEKIWKELKVGDVLVDFSECPVTDERNGTIHIVLEITHEWGETEIKTVSEPDDFQDTQWLGFATMKDIQDSDNPSLSNFVFMRENNVLSLNFEKLIQFAADKLR